MKRLLLLVLCCFFLTSCTDKAYNAQITLYNRFVNETNNKDNVNSNLPFDIGVYFEKIIDDEITYRVIIDNPKENIKNIKAIAVHNRETKDVYPTSGIFETPLNLIPGTIDLKSNFVKGIILVGYIDYKGEVDSFKATVKVFVEYNSDDGKLNRIYYEYHK